MMYFIFVACGIYLERLHNRQAYLAILNDRYQKIADESEGLNEKMERIKRIKAKLDTKAFALNYLFEVSRLLPQEIIITNMSFQKDEKLNVKGRARELPDVFKFIATLENSPYFKDIQTRYTTIKKYKDRDVTEFELVCPMEGSSDAKKVK
jgi:Tfp pilus assembly protein PilN